MMTTREPSGKLFVTPPDHCSDSARCLRVSSERPAIDSRLTTFSFRVSARVNGSNRWEIPTPANRLTSSAFRSYSRHFPPTGGSRSVMIDGSLLSTIDEYLKRDYEID